MLKLVFAILFSSLVSQAVVHSFYPCVAEKDQAVIKKVRETLYEPTKPGHADLVGYYELRKNQQVVGYLPFFYDGNKQVIAEAYLCSTSGRDYYYVTDAAADIKNWIPKVRNAELKGIVNDEATSSLRLTKVNNSEIKVDFFIRFAGGGQDLIKDVAILSLNPKKDL